MFRLSRITDYGLVLMAQLASREHEGVDVPQNAREIATAAQLPHPVASKVLKSLAREGLLESHRGARGGFRLARPAADITVAEVIVALEGPIGLTECTVHPGTCAQELSCHVREPWQQINRVVRDALEGVTLADLARPAAPPPRSDVLVIEPPSLES